MGEILGIGLSHYPGLVQPDKGRNHQLTRALDSGRLTPEQMDPANWRIWLLVILPVNLRVFLDIFGTLLFAGYMLIVTRQGMVVLLQSIAVDANTSVLWSTNWPPASS